MGRDNRSYLITCVASLIVILIVFFSINIMMDPLWYVRGNVLHDRNFAFNERLSKTNRFVKHADSYDCIIFGSSRVTLLDERLIEGHNCFNYSFSGGRIEEILFFADYLVEMNIEPSLVIVGIDDFNFVRNERELAVPDFVKEKTGPPGIFRSYLSLDALEFSYRLLRSDSPLPRYYDDEFSCVISADAPAYKPEYKKAKKSGTDPDKYKKYIQLRGKFRKARFVGYVPPLSSWQIASKHDEELRNYLFSIYEISRSFSETYDFSVPSGITANKKNTYDGSHFNSMTNRHIAERINGRSGAFGLRVDTLTRDMYMKKFIQAREDFLASIQEG